MTGQLPPGFGKKPPTQINVNLDDAKQVICGHCGCPFFQPALSLKEISPLVSKSGNPELVAQNIIVCISCKQLVGSKPNVVAKADN
jgi:hypothetical protein